MSWATATDCPGFWHRWARRGSGDRPADSRNPQPIVELKSAAAPVQQIVLKGDDCDFTQLPVHLQHALDGGPYISASIDYVIDPDSGFTNIGSRRLMLRGRREAGIDLVAPSDLQAIYRRVVAKKQRLPISFTVGSHPIDFMAAAMRLPGDELALLAALRGEPTPVVRCLTNDVRVPADAEIVLEGYLDECGWSRPEGPYGEFFGYYGEMKMNPVFHLTAITMRRDALFQSVTIGGRFLARTETAQIGTIRTELGAWRALKSAVREPLEVYAPPRVPVFAPFAFGFAKEFLAKPKTQSLLYSAALPI